MVEERKTPEIRFDGFTTDWRQQQLDEFCDFYTGLTYSPENVVDSTGTLVLRSSNVKDGEIVDADNVYVDSATVNCSNVGLGDIVVVVRNGSRNLIGKHGQVKREMKNTVIGAFMTGLRPSQPEFVNTLLDTPKFDIEIAKNLGATINQITTGVFKQMTFSIPNNEQEQTAIGSFFRTLDDAIALKKQQHGKTVNIKKAMLEKMFPRKGADVPEIRFEGYNTIWDYQLLGELCLIGDIDHWMPNSVEYGIPYVMTGDFVGINGLDFKNAKKVSLEDYKRLSRKIKPEKGDILFARYASIGTVRLVETRQKFLVSYSCAIIKASKRIESDYLYYYFQSETTQRQMELTINMGSQGNIGIDSLKKVSIQMPEKQEQIAIGKFFLNLDSLIETQEQELEKLQNIKKACLNKMFV